MSALLAVMVADTTHVAASSSRDLVEIVFVGGSLIASVAAVLGVGIQWGRHAEFKDATNDRLRKLETTDGHSITREELDARFSEVKTMISTVSELIRHITTNTSH